MESDDNELDETINALFNKLTLDSECDIALKQFANFDSGICFIPLVKNYNLVIDWRPRSLETCFHGYLSVGQEHEEDSVVMMRQ